jgi:hypothetical protein
MALRERFEGPRYRQARRVLAQRLVDGRHDDIINLEVGAFFELLGTLTRNKVLDLELVWEAFGTWVAGYYWALRHPVDLIGRARTALQDPLIFHEFEWLDARVREMDRAKLGTHTASTASPEQDAQALLRREAALEED